MYINLCGLHKLVSFIMVRENLYNVFTEMRNMLL